MCTCPCKHVSVSHRVYLGLPAWAGTIYRGTVTLSVTTPQKNMPCFLQLPLSIVAQGGIGSHEPLKDPSCRKFWRPRICHLNTHVLFLNLEKNTGHINGLTAICLLKKKGPCPNQIANMWQSKETAGFPSPEHLHNSEWLLETEGRFSEMTKQNYVITNSNSPLLLVLIPSSSPPQDSPFMDVLVLFWPIENKAILL